MSAPIQKSRIKNQSPAQGIKLRSFTKKGDVDKEVDVQKKDVLETVVHQ